MKSTASSGLTPHLQSALRMAAAVIFIAHGT